MVPGNANPREKKLSCVCSCEVSNAKKEQKKGLELKPGNTWYLQELLPKFSIVPSSCP
jgi:hypothetical protein